MTKVWKVVSTIALIALLLGALCILAGVVTGGDFERIKNVFFTVYDIENRMNAMQAGFAFMN